MILESEKTFVEKSRLLYLDTARGLAAMSVITWHCYTAIINHPENSRLYTSPFHFFLYGEANMIFFFIHSGFILSYSNAFFERSISPGSYLDYIIRRMFRIYPLFIIVLFLSYFLKSTIYPLHFDNYLSSHFLRFWSNQIHLTDVFKQSILAIRIPDNANLRLIPQDWTLTIEVLICPLIPFLNFLNRRFKFICWLLVFILLRFLHFNTYLFEFTIGVNLYSFRHQISRIWNKTNLFIKFLVLTLGILLYTCFFGYPNIFDPTSKVFSPFIDRLMVVFGCSIFFIFILNSTRIKKAFSHSIFVKIGKICYSLYVNHIILLLCFSNLFMAILRRFITGPEWFITLLFVLFFQCLTILVSLVTYKYIEKPFNRWGKVLSTHAAQFVAQSFRRSVPPIV
jgi:peptidoglycan/LPS O-acetylase OafA/YrhL